MSRFLREERGIFCCVTQSEEGFLQISLHLLPDALLDVVRTVALVPLKHCETQRAGHNLCDITFNRKLCLEQEEARSRSRPLPPC